MKPVYPTKLTVRPNRHCSKGAGWEALWAGLFVTWGYLDRPNASQGIMVATHVLSFAVPALFLAGAVGILVLRGSQLGIPGWAGIALTLYGPAVGLAAHIVDVEHYIYLASEFFAPFVGRGWIM